MGKLFHKNPEEGGFAKVWTKITRTGTGGVTKRLRNILLDVKIIQSAFTLVKEDDIFNFMPK